VQCNVGDGQRSPILDAEFFELLLKHFGTGCERLAIALAGKQLVAAGIFHPAARFSRHEAEYS
jgi:hypothetical protein